MKATSVPIVVLGNEIPTLTIALFSAQNSFLPPIE